MEANLMMINIDSEATGKRLRELRLKKNLSVKAVAECMFLHIQSVYSWEDGYNVPSVDNLIRLKYLYGVQSIDDLIVEGQ